MHYHHLYENCCVARCCLQATRCQDTFKASAISTCAETLQTVHILRQSPTGYTYRPFYKREDNIRPFPQLSEWKSSGGGVVMESNELKQEGLVILASFLFLPPLFGESGFTSDLSNVSLQSVCLNRHVHKPASTRHTFHTNQSMTACLKCCYVWDFTQTSGLPFLLHWD